MIYLFSRNKIRLCLLIYVVVGVGFILFSHLKSHLGVSPDFRDISPAGHPPLARAIVAASRESGDTAWMHVLENSTLVNPAWAPFIYHTDGDSVKTSASLRAPPNKGREAMVYLTFIIDNYEFLPAYTVFIHGHEDAWHQEANLIKMLQNLRFEALDEEGYISLRCDWYPSCPAEIRPKTHDAVVWGPGLHRADTEIAIGEVWNEFFPSAPLPDTIASQCCSQFAVTRARIRSRDKATYTRMREWLLRTPLIDDISSRVLEKLWAYIFTYNAVHCPYPAVCACDYFGLCEIDRTWPMPPIMSDMVLDTANPDA